MHVAGPKVRILHYVLLTLSPHRISATNSKRKTFYVGGEFLLVISEKTELIRFFSLIDWKVNISIIFYKLKNTVLKLV